ncbi:MAG: phosphopentomutase [Acidobacteria bacterium]|nr:phosphopentomutase [Acidobacteriota bacterium]MCA1643096.1 phosphopentomutase [Acidobacteriota bacterium]
MSSENAKTFDRICLIVLDSVGMGEMPDAAAWGDAGSDTLGHICETRVVRLPNLQAWGLGNARPLENIPPAVSPRAAYGRCALRSNGKDTTTGHWEMAGIILEKAFPTYPEGFPSEIIDEFVKQANLPGILGNYAASGTEIIKELGAEHVRTGKPIVYTSADSVFQIAAHEETIPLPRLYEICETARRILRGRHEVGRVIARPFLGAPGAFYRTENRHDYAVPPPRENLLETISGAGLAVVAVGKIASIYDSAGVTEDLPGKNNDQSIDQTINALRGDTRGLIFSNLVDFDMLYGHRRDPEGYARALEHFDSRLPEIASAMRDTDLLIITADHGNDPTYRGTDHTREYVPLIAHGARARAGIDLGTRASLADIGQTVAENFGLRLGAGESFLREIG